MPDLIHAPQSVVGPELKRFHYSTAVEVVRFFADRGVIEIVWRGGRMLSYSHCTRDDFLTLTTGSAPGRRVSAWLKARRQKVARQKR